MSRTPPQPLIPVLALLVAACFWGTVWYPLRWLELHGVNGLWTTLIAYVASLPVLLLIGGRRVLELRRYPIAALALLFAVGWCNVAFVLAIIDGVVVRVLLLFYLSPVWTVLFGWLVLRERLHAGVGLLLLMAMIGSLFLLWEPGTGFVWPLPRADLLALTSGMGFALSNVLVRHMQEVTLTSKLLVSWVGVVLVAMAGILVVGDPTPAVSGTVLGGVVALGMAGFLVATYAVQYGVTHMPVQRSAVILLTELVWGGVSAAWLAGEALGMRDYIGGGLILLAGYLVTLKQEQELNP
ncbi:MAG TPA: DMT family transporter [Chromatiales bacterium]|nr:DMT family transporter [Chromatiales bacterium]